MSYPKFDAIIKTAETGSFTKAAELLGYTQPRISYIIQSLESEWGVSLLTRERTGVRLTSEGEILMPFLKEVCNAHDSLERKIDELHGLESGLIRIGTVGSVALHWLPNIIKHYIVDYPQIDFEILHGSYTDIEQWIGEGIVDFGFLRYPLCEKWDSIPLGEDRLMVIMPHKHRLAKAKKFPTAELANEPFILIMEGKDNNVVEFFEQHNITPNIRFTAMDDATATSMVESGLGICILPELMLHRTPYRIIKKEMDIPFKRHICLAIKNLENTTTAVKRFMEYLHYRNDE